MLEYGALHRLPIRATCNRHISFPSGRTTVSSNATSDRPTRCHCYSANFLAYEISLVRFFAKVRKRRIFFLWRFRCFRVSFVESFSFRGTLLSYRLNRQTLNALSSVKVGRQRWL